MPRTIALAETAYTAPTTISFGPVNIPPNQTGIAIELSRVSWPAGEDVVSILIDFSPDGGDTWIAPFISFSAPGGVVYGVDGVTVSTISKLIAEWPEPDNNKRRVQGSMTVNSSLTTEVTIEFT